MTSSNFYFSKPFKVLTFSDFGDTANPLWHLELEFKSCAREQLWALDASGISSNLLIPLEMLSADEIHHLESLPQTARQKISLQVGLAQIHKFNFDQFKKLNVQIWLDRDLTTEDYYRLASLCETSELVVIPFRNFDIKSLLMQISLFEVQPISILMLPKLNPFSGLFDLQSLYALFLELKRSTPKIQPLILEDGYESLPLETRNFLIHLSLDNLEAFKKSQNFSDYVGFKAVRSFLPTSILGALISIFMSIKHPTHLIQLIKNFAVQTYWLVYRFTKQILLFPFFKIYWFSKYQYQKRILKVPHEL